MTGKELKQRLGKYGLCEVEFSQIINGKRVNEIFESDDVLSSEIETLCSLFKLPVSCIYGDAESVVAVKLSEYGRLMRIDGEHKMLSSYTAMLENKIEELQGK